MLSAIGMTQNDLDAFLKMNTRFEPLDFNDNSFSPLQEQLTKTFSHTLKNMQATPSNITSSIPSHGDHSLSTDPSTTLLADSVHSHSNVTGSYEEKASKDKVFVATVLGLNRQLQDATDELGKVKADLMAVNDELGKVKADLNIATTEKNKLQKKLDDALLKLDHASANCDVSLPIKKELKDVIEAQTKSILWSRVKFIQSPEEEMMAAKMLIRFAQKKLPQEQLKSKASRKALATTYKVIIRRAIFQKRAAEHKKVMMKRLKEKGTMPRVLQLALYHV